MIRAYRYSISLRREPTIPVLVMASEKMNEGASDSDIRLLGRHWTSNDAHPVVTVLYTVPYLTSHTVPDLSSRSDHSTCIKKSQSHRLVT